MDTRQARCAPAAHQWDTDGSCTVCGATGRDVAARYQASVSGDETMPFKAGQRVRRVIDGYRGTVETVSAYQGTHAVAVRMDSDGAVWSGTTIAWEATNDETMGTYDTSSRDRVVVKGTRNGFVYVTFVTGGNRGTTVKVPSSWVVIDEAPTTGDPFDEATATRPTRPAVTRDPFDEATYARNVGANVTAATPYRIPVGDLFRTNPRHDFESSRGAPEAVGPCAVCGMRRSAQVHS